MQVCICFSVFLILKILCFIRQLLKKLSRLLYNIVVLFIPWEVRIKKIESESPVCSTQVIKVMLWSNVISSDAVEEPSYSKTAMFYLLICLYRAMWYFQSTETETKSLPVYHCIAVCVWGDILTQMYFSVLMRSLWVRRGLLLYLPPLVVWDQHRPHHHDRSLHCPTRGLLVRRCLLYKGPHRILTQI